MATTPPAAVVFDCDGLLLDTESAWTRAEVVLYRRYGVESESWHLQKTDHGPWVIVVTEIADPVDAAPRYADATEAFHLWFKSQVETLTGVDPNIAPLGPPTKEVFVWQNHASTTQGQAATPA